METDTYPWHVITILFNAYTHSTLLNKKSQTCEIFIQTNVLEIMYTISWSH